MKAVNAGTMHANRNSLAWRSRCCDHDATHSRTVSVSLQRNLLLRPDPPIRAITVWTGNDATCTG